jgi:hypothetical protein
MALEDNIPRIPAYDDVKNTVNDAIDSISPSNIGSAVEGAIGGMIPDIGLPDLGGFLPDVDFGGIMPDIAGCAGDALEGLIPDLGGIGGLLSGNPLCDENLFKDIDGLASLGSLPSVPDIDSIIAASGIPDLAKKLDPEVMFSGIPEFSGLIKMPKIPEVSLAEVEAAAKNFANDVLGSLNIDNPLADLCQFKLPAIPTIPDVGGMIDGMVGDLMNVSLGDIGGELGGMIPDVGGMLPDVDGLMPDIPGLDCLVGSIELPSIDIGDII